MSENVKCINMLNDAASSSLPGCVLHRFQLTPDFEKLQSNDIRTVFVQYFVPRLYLFVLYFISFAP